MVGQIKDCFLSTGANLGHRLEQLLQANAYIEQRIGTIHRASSFYLTEAWGKTNQPHFLNQVLWVRTTLEGTKILNEIQCIEQALGRRRIEHWGARNIDIDILFVDGEQINTKHLVVPHPQLIHRNFVLAPFCELAPNWVHPTHQKSMQELLEACTDPLAALRLTQKEANALEPTLLTSEH